MPFSDNPLPIERKPTTRRPIPLDAWLGVLCVSGLSFLIVFGTRLLPKTPERHRSSVAAGAAEWQELRVARVTPSGQRYSEPLPGRVVVDERKSARVGSPLAARVERVHVELGQRVERGAALLTLSSIELPALRSALAQADNALAWARAEDARVQSMVRERLLPAKEALSSAARLRQAELAQQHAAARLQALRLGSAREHSFVVRAESSGTVVEKNVLASQAVTPGNSLLQIADLDAGVFVVADVFESDLGTVRVGAPARISLLSAPHETLESRVDMVADVVDPIRRTVQVRMHVKNTRLRVNERVQVSLLRSAPAGATEVSSTAVLSDGEQHKVYVVDEAGNFQRRIVVPGWENAGRTVILAGLLPDETVVEQRGYLLDSQAKELL